MMKAQKKTRPVVRSRGDLSILEQVGDACIARAGSALSAEPCQADRIGSAIRNVNDVRAW